MSRPLLALALFASGLSAGLRAQAPENSPHDVARRSAAVEAAAERSHALAWVPALVIRNSKRAFELAGSEAVSAEHSAPRAEGSAAGEPIEGAPAMPTSSHLNRVHWTPPATSGQTLAPLGLASPEPLMLVVAGIAILGLVFFARRRPA